MYFLFVLVVCVLSLSTLFKEKCCSLEKDIYNTYGYMDIHQQYSSTIYELAFQKRHLYIFLVLVYVHTENCIQNMVVIHHLDCLSSSFLQVMSS